MNIYWLYQF